MARTKKAPPDETTPGDAAHISDSPVTTSVNILESTIKQVECYLREGISDRELAPVIVLKLVCRVDRLSDQIAVAFAGEPFNLNFAPDAPANLARFRAYVSYHSRASRLLLDLVRVSLALRMDSPKPTSEALQKKGDKQKAKPKMTDLANFAKRTH